MKKVLFGLLVVTACGDNGGGDVGTDECVFSTPEDDIADPEIYTPRWAFEPWISKDISDRDDTLDFVQGFMDRDIPVGVVVIDSPWETQYHTYVPNPERYPQFEQMVTDLKSVGVRTVLWTTQMVNDRSIDLEEGGDTDLYENPSPNFKEGERCDFYVEGGDTFFWWKGFGAGLDFNNPEAVAWRRRQQDQVLDMGIAGWKLDFGDEYIDLPQIETATGMVSKQEYSESYYQEFYRYGASKLGTDEFITMVRPYDESYQFPGRFFARKEHAPVAWVGDNRRDWFGLSDALDHMFRSAEAGYAMIGADIGGYLNVNDIDQTEAIPFDSETFARWIGQGALTPFMQLHGRANLEPWAVPDNAERVTAVYRYYANLHSELVPFFYSLTRDTYDGGEPVMRPIGELADWAGDYRYMLGEALLVAPILGPGGTRDVILPPGEWYDWWQPDADAIDGDTTLNSVDASDWLTVPLYVRAGAIIPAKVSSDITGLGTAMSAGALSVIVYPGLTENQFDLRDEDDATTAITTVRTNLTATVTLSRVLRTTIIRMRADNPAGVTYNGTALPEVLDINAVDSGYQVDAANRQVWIKIPAGSGDATVIAATPITG